MRPLQARWTRLTSCRYIVIPLAFGADDSTHVNKANTLVAAAVLIAFAYTLSFMITCFQYDQQDYLLHSVFL